MSIQTSGIMELIATLRKEGILEIENERNNIIKLAQQNAAKIVENAKNTAKNILHKCNTDCLAQKKKLDNELKMASRDFILVFSKNIKNHIIQPIVKKNIQDIVNDGQFLKNILINILKDIIKEDNNNLLVLLDIKKKNELIEFFSSNLFKNMLNNNKIMFDFTNKFEGFQIIKKNDKLIWDFTLNSLTQEIGKLVEPHLLKYFI